MASAARAVFSAVQVDGAPGAGALAGQKCGYVVAVSCRWPCDGRALFLPPRAGVSPWPARGHACQFLPTCRSYHTCQTFAPTFVVRPCLAQLPEPGEASPLAVPRSPPVCWKRDSARPPLWKGGWLGVEVALVHNSVSCFARCNKICLFARCCQSIGQFPAGCWSPRAQVSCWQAWELLEGMRVVVLHGVGEGSGWSTGQGGLQSVRCWYWPPERRELGSRQRRPPGGPGPGLWDTWFWAPVCEVFPGRGRGSSAQVCS